MNKNSNSNNPKIIQIDVKGAITYCSPPNYGHIARGIKG